MKNFKLKPQVFFDYSLSDLAQLECQKVLIVCDPFFVQNGVLTEIMQHLKNTTKIEVYSDVTPDPNLDQVVSGVDIYQTLLPDVMIALGGGSAIDLAKGILYFASKMIQNTCQLIAMPTTSGTGSEVTSFAVITDTLNKKKIPIVCESLLPDIAILSYDLIANLPKQVVSFTGMDALTHSIEALVSTNACPYSDAFAIASIQLINKYLITSYTTTDQEARSQMHHAATMAGMAFNHASLGINHAIAHQLGAHFHIPHGQCNAILLPYVIELNAKDDKAKQIYNQLAYDLHLTSSLSKIGYRSLINWVTKLQTKFGIESSLRSCNIKQSDYKASLDIIAQNALNDACYATTPYKLSKDELIKFLEVLY